MSKKKQYTFDDWKTGKIYFDFEDHVIEDFNYQEVEDIGWLPTKLYEQGFMAVEEFRKIDKTQKETFFKTVAQNVKVMVKLFKKNLENAYKPVELIRTKIQSLDEEIEKAPNHILEKVYSGDWSRIGIDFSGHMTIDDSRFIEADGMRYFSNQLIGFDGAGKKQTIDLKGKYSNSYNHVFALAIMVRLLDELEKLYEKKYSKIEKSSESDYGTHQPNRNWIISKFEEQEKEQPSQNKTLEKVRDLYQEKYSLNIGKTTILRMVGRAE